MKRTYHFTDHIEILPEHAFRSVSKMRTIQCLVPALLAMAGLANAQDFSALSSCAVGGFASHVLAVLQFAFFSPQESVSGPFALISSRLYQRWEWDR